MNRHTRDGVVLIEILVAIMILGSGGAALAGRIVQELHQVEILRDREAELFEAEQLIARAALLTRGELELRLGRRPAGNLLLITSRPASTVFRLAVSRADAPGNELLVTLVHRRGDT